MEESGLFGTGEFIEYTDIQRNGFIFNDLINELKRNNVQIMNRDYVYNPTDSEDRGAFLVRLRY